VSYLREFSTRATPQNEPIPGSAQVPNDAGGHAWAVDDWARLERFLVLGAEGGSYYASERKLTVANAEATVRCIAHDGSEAVRRIVAVSEAGRAPKNDPAIFALALAAGIGDDATRRAALDALPRVCRTGAHLFTFATFVEQFRGWGRGLRRAVGAWYTGKEPDGLAYQVVKYRQRGGWTHDDLLRLVHASSGDAAIAKVLEWIARPQDGSRRPVADSLPKIIEAFERAQAATTPAETAQVVAAHPDLPREALNPDHLTDPLVWDALLRAGMPMTALIRNLATMTRIGLLKPMSEASRLVCEQIADGDRLRKARVHPLAVLVALKTYERGQSARSGQTWSPVPAVIDALDSAFYQAFGNVTPTNKRTMLSLDVSGSMGFAEIAGMPGITPRVGSAAMALVTAAVEPNHVVTAFSTEFVQLSVSPRQRLDDVVRGISHMPFGGTDCSLPVLAAEATGAEIDTFIIYTDSETWAGRMHPSQALERYRQKTGINAKLVVVGMVSNGFTIADPNDPGMLDVVGFDTATPNVISEFAA
jgi:60 kDa SS-A/Ro ribonucleoprotein